MVHIAHIKTGAFAAQTARAQRRERAFVAQLGQRVGLIHELRELTGAKELAQRGDHRPDVNQGNRRNLVLVANGHALFDDALHAAQADAQFILDQFTHRLYAAVAKVINIILVFFFVIDQDHAAQQVNHVPTGHRAVGYRDALGQIEFLIKFVPANALQVIMALIEELLLQELAGIFERGRVAGAHALEEFKQRSFSDGQAAAQVPDRFLTQGGGDQLAVRIVVHILEERDQLFVRALFDRRIHQTIIDSRQRAQENGDRNGALAVELENEIIVLAGLKFHPGAAIGDQLGHRQAVAGGAVHRGFKINARRADELRNHHAFRTINNESALVGHFREITQENIRLDWLGDFRPRQQHRNVQRAGIRQIPLDAFVDGVLRVSEPVLQPPLLGFR